MNNTFSPYNFLKSRRPNKFSDSVLLKKAKLTREFFDFYLNSLTSRSQEKLFEGFCKRIVEFEVCPNLITQTGPTGGGDSKVDSETYPVSDDVSLTWYSGIGREAASERWAFAISAKKDWKAKVKSDVAKILSTDREYKKIFFMSNQYISDKKRADTEDELSRIHAIDIRIFDRNWLLDRLFQNNREHIAVEVFNLSNDFIDEQKIGQLDYRRKQELEEIEQNIKKLASERKFDLEIVDKSIRAAILSRELELPLNDTTGRFNRASILAVKYGTDFQMKECSYQWAWSLYWWYEEFDEFINKYCDYEKNVIGTKNFYDIERLTNLWMCLYAVNKVNPQEKIFKERTEILVNEYERLINDQNRPDTALEARTNFIFVNLFLDSDINKAFKDLNQVMEDCDNNIDFSFETISAILTEIALEMQDSTTFDELFEKVVSMAGIREQEIVSSLMLFKRGQQLIESKPYSAIKYLGRALLSLYKDETKGEFYLTLYMLAYAHEKAGLLWAAREQIPDTPSLGFCNIERIDSKILGCKIIIDADNKFPCVELGESILAALESFLATGISDRIISFTPVINLKIKFAKNDVFSIY